MSNLEWITDNLLKKIEASPFLAKLLMDPEFTAALSQVQADPMKAMSMLGSKPEMQKALQELSGILGEHFTTLGQSSAGVVRKPLLPSQGIGCRVSFAPVLRKI